MDLGELEVHERAEEKLSDAPCNWVDRPFGGCGYGNDDAKRYLNVNAVRTGRDSLGVVHLV